MDDLVILDNQDLKAQMQFFTCLTGRNCTYQKIKKSYMNYCLNKLNSLSKNLKNILNTLIKPESFIDFVLAKSCDQSVSNFQCWNGYEVGEYVCYSFKLYW